MSKKLLLLTLFALGLVLGLYIQAIFFTPELGTDVNQRIELFLQENPGVVLEVLQKNSESLFDLVLEGQEKKRHSAMVAGWKQQLENPTKVKFDHSRPMRGNPDAPVTILEFSDFQCPHCFRASRTVRELLKRHPDLIKLYFFNFPLRSHKEAHIAAQYFEAAALQDYSKAWKLHDILFDNQLEVKKGGADWIKQKAGEIGLDVQKLEADANSERVAKRIENDLELTDIHELAGAPSFIINGVLLSGAGSLQEFEEVINIVLENKKEKAAAKASTPSKKNTQTQPE